MDAITIMSDLARTFATLAQSLKPSNAQCPILNATCNTLSINCNWGGGSKSSDRHLLELLSRLAHSNTEV